MIDKQLLDILVCPLDRTPLCPADEDLLGRLNRAIADEPTEIVNLGGGPLAEPLAAALVRQDRKVFYPVVDGIPVLLADEAVALEQIDG